MKYIYLLLLVWLGVGCSSLEVHHDYDENYNFSKVRTFSITHRVKEGESTLVNDRITSALKDVLTTKGYKNVQSDAADLIFVYHYGAKDKVDIRTDYQMVGIHRYGFGGSMIATQSTYKYTEASIIIDAYNPKTNKIVFRSIGTLELEHQKTPQEKKAYVEKIILKVMKNFPSQK